MRFRYWLMGVGVPVLMATLFLTDPDAGLLGKFGMSATAALFLGLASPLLAVLMAHLSRRGLFDYLDMEKLANDASDSPQGSGLVFLGVCVVIAALLGLFGRSANAAVPTQAHQYLPMLKHEVDAHWPNVPHREYFGGLIEHETACPRVRSCWLPTARLKTQREEGAGFPQITRAWSKTGALRFDALTEMRERHPALRELSWANVYQRPDLQMRVLVLKVRANFVGLASVQDRSTRLLFANAGYNGGMGGVNAERRTCGMKPGCDPQQWFGHVELVRTKSQAALYGTRSPWDINRHHSRDIWLHRMPQYKGLV